MTSRFWVVWLGCLLLLCSSACGRPEGDASRSDLQGAGATATGITPLTNGVALTALSGAASSEQLFSIELPTNAASLKVRLTRGSGDPDLYVRRGSAPTTSVNDCKSVSSGSVDECTLTSPLAGTWYILVRGYSAFSGTSLVGTYSFATSTPVELTPGQPVPVSGLKDEQLRFTLLVPPGQKVLNFKTSGGTGDPDLFVQFGSAPTTTSYRCASTNAGGTELCAIDNPEAGTWHVMLRGYADFTSVSLVGDYSPLANLLGNGEIVTVSGATGSQRYWAIDVPANQTALRIRTTGGTGNVDLYVSFGAPPTTTTATCTSATPGSPANEETCSFTSPQAGTWYVMLRGTSDYANVVLTSYSLNAEGTPVKFLVTDRAESPLRGEVGELFHYALEVPAGQTQLRVRTTGSSTGNPDLYVRFGERASTTTYDCASVAAYANEECVITNPQAGTWFILVHAKTAFRTIALHAYSVNGTLPTPELTPGKPHTHITHVSGDEPRAFTVQVPPGYGKLRVSLSSGDSLGSPSMYVGFGARPNPASSSTYVCQSSWLCEINEPKAGTWHVVVVSGSRMVNASLTARYTGELFPTVELVNGQALTGLSASPDDVRVFTLNVPSGQGRLRFDMSSSRGEPKVAIRAGAMPTDSSSGIDCEGTLFETPSACVFNFPRAGLWYVRIRASEEVTDLSLKASYGPANPELPIQPLADGQWVTDLSGSPLVDQFFRFEMPPNIQSARFETLAGNGMATVLFQYGAKPPATGSPSCKNSCDVTAPKAGTWYLRVRGQESYSGVGIRVTTQRYPALPLNQWVGPMTFNFYEGRYYRVEVPSGLSALRLESTISNAGDVHLQAAFGALPTGANCNVVQPDGGRRCVIPNPQAGTWYVRATNESTLEAQIKLRIGTDRLPEPTVTLADNVPAQLSDFQGNYRFFTLQVPSGQLLLNVDLLTRQDAELFVKHGSAPTTTDYKCTAVSTQAQPGASCAVQAPAAGTWFVMVKAADGFKGLLRATTSPSRALVNGMPDVAVSGAQGEERLYRFEVPPGMSDLAFTLRGVLGGGSPRLFVRYGAPPDTTADCTFELLGLDESTCAFTQPAAGTWYAAVRGVSSAFSGVVLTGTYVAEPGEGVPTLTNGVALNGLWGGAYDRKLWKLEVPAGQSLLRFDLSGGEGFADLFVQHAARPTLTSSACHANGTAGNVATCTVPNPAAGTWFVMVGNAYSYSGASLTGTYSREGDTRPLARGAPVPNLFSTPDLAQYFQVEVPPGQGFLSLDLFGNVTNAVMTVRNGALPTAADTACAVVTTGRRACELQNPAAGTWYVRLSGTFSGALLSADHDEVGATDGIQPLVNGGAVWTSACITSSKPLRYKLEVPPGASKLTFSTQGTSSCGGAGVDLRVLLGSPATLSDYECLSNASGSTETCTLLNPAAGTWYVLVSGEASSVRVVGRYE